LIRDDLCPLDLGAARPGRWFCRAGCHPPFRTPCGIWR